MEYDDYIESAALRAFVAVVREGSFSAAARVLRIQQPAVSKAVKNLEARVGQPLLERKRSGVVPTAAGQRAFDRASRIAEETTLLLSEARAACGELEGELWLSTNEHVATYVMPHAIAAFKRAHPRVVPRIVTTAAQLAVGEVASGRHELGVFFKVETSSRLDRKVLARADCQLVVARRLRRDPHTLEHFIGSREVDDLSNKAFPTLRMLQKKRPATAITVSCTSLEAHKQLLLAGYGVSIVPLFVVARELAEGTLVVVEKDYVYEATLELVVRRDHELSPAAREFVRCLRDALPRIKGVRPRE